MNDDEHTSDLRDGLHLRDRIIAKKDTLLGDAYRALAGELPEAEREQVRQRIVDHLEA